MHCLLKNCSTNKVLDLFYNMYSILCNLYIEVLEQSHQCEDINFASFLRIILLEFGSVPNVWYTFLKIKLYYLGEAFFIVVL
jgi:hypothetical protein